MPVIAAADQAGVIGRACTRSLATLTRRPLLRDSAPTRKIGREKSGLTSPAWRKARRFDLWNIKSGVTFGAMIAFRWDGRVAVLSLEAPELDLSAEASGRDLFDGLQQLRRHLGAGWYPLCNGARIDCYPSGMARDMGGARAVYELTIGKAGRPPLVGLFEPAPAEKVGTVAEQNLYNLRWLATSKT